MAEKLTPEATRKLLDELFALPDKVAKPKAAPKKTSPATPVPQKRVATVGELPAGFEPTHRVLEVVHQNCTTCGSQHSYIRSRRVRFERKAGHGLSHAYEVATVVAEELPTQVDHTWQDTNVCPTCLILSKEIEDILCMTAPGWVQQELFHG